MTMAERQGGGDQGIPLRLAQKASLPKRKKLAKTPSAIISLACPVIRHHITRPYCSLVMLGDTVCCGNLPIKKEVDTT